jgi:hypothetical protein
MLKQNQKIRKVQNKYWSETSVLSQFLLKTVIDEIANKSKIKGPDTKTVQ